MAERKSVVIDAVRSPIGVKRGIMAGNIRSDDLAAQVLSQLMDRNEGVSRDAVEDVVHGMCIPGGFSGNAHCHGQRRFWPGLPLMQEPKW